MKQAAASSPRSSSAHHEEAPSPPPSTAPIDILPSAPPASTGSPLSSYHARGTDMNAIIDSTGRRSRASSTGAANNEGDGDDVDISTSSEHKSSPVTPIQPASPSPSGVGDDHAYRHAQEQIKRKDETIQSLRDTMSSQEQHLATLMTKLADASREISKYKDLAAEHEESLNNSNLRLASVEDLLKISRESEKVTGRKNEENQQALASLRNSLNEATFRAEQDKSQLNTRIKEQESLIINLKDQISEIKLKSSETKAEHEALLTDSRRVNDDMRSQIESLRQQLQKANQLIADNDARASGLNMAVRMVEKRYAAAIVVPDGVTSIEQPTALQKTYMDQSKQISQLKNDLEDSQQQYASIIMMLRILESNLPTEVMTKALFGMSEAGGITIEMVYPFTLAANVLKLGKHGNWNKRYVVLRPPLLFYFTTLKAGEEARGVFRTDKIQTERIDAKKTQLKILPRNSDPIIFQFASEDELLEWQTALKNSASLDFVSSLEKQPLPALYS